MQKEAVDRSSPRPGGRSARVQNAVHRAVRQLQADGGEGELTVPAVAARAGVTPSTIYRRWGTLSQLLSEVALEKLRPETAPVDTGSLKGDLTLWLEQYVEEMASAPGRAMIRDILRETLPGNASQCSAFTYGQIEQIHARAVDRGELPPPAETLVGTRHRAPHVSDFVHSGAAHGRRSAPPSRRGPDVPVRAKQHRRPRPINDFSPVPKQTLSRSTCRWDLLWLEPI